MSLSSELEQAQREIESYAREFGLDFFPVIFEIVDYRQMNEIVSYAGFPVRYPHWRWGMEYERTRKSYSYGLHHVYELVINNNPCYAYLLRGNTLLDQKLVISHVLAHSDFFKNNLWFSSTNRKMLDEMANHGARVQRYIDRYGESRVEEFLDICLSIEDLIDLHSQFIKRRAEEHPPLSSLEGDEDEEREDIAVRKLPSKPYMDRWVNPPDFVEEQRKQAVEQRQQMKRKLPAEPQKDVLLFLIENAPIDNWQRDVLSMIREESYYFAPQAMTKILNEGWATFFHSRIMTQKVLSAADAVDYADHHSGVVAAHPGKLNPYKLGLELLRDIEDRWNKGKFGKDYDECEDAELRRNWDKKLGLGVAKIFEVRRTHNEVTFIDTFLTEEFCQKHNLFVFEFNQYTGYYEVASRDFEEIKRKLLFMLTNLGKPIIYITDGNYKNRSELYLLHKHEGVDLRMDWAIETLHNLQRIWQRPVHLETVRNGRRTRITHEGNEHVTEELF